MGLFGSLCPIPLWTFWSRPDMGLIDAHVLFGAFSVRLCAHCIPRPVFGSVETSFNGGFLSVFFASRIGFLPNYVSDCHQVFQCRYGNGYSIRMSCSYRGVCMLAESSRPNRAGSGCHRLGYIGHVFVGYAW